MAGNLQHIRCTSYAYRGVLAQEKLNHVARHVVSIGLVRITNCSLSPPLSEAVMPIYADVYSLTGTLAITLNLKILSAFIDLNK